MKYLDQVRGGMHVALIAMSVAVILHVGDLPPEAKTVFWSLFLGDCAVSTFLLLRRRRHYLTLTPTEIHARFMADGPFTTGPLERCASVLGFIAVAMLLWSN
jgi:hypothetical protein